MPGWMLAAASARRKKQKRGRLRFLAWHALAPPTLVVPRECGGSSTPRLIGSITGASGILGHPPSRVTTIGGAARSRSSNTPSRSRDMNCPRFASSFALVEKEGAGKTGCALHPRSRVQLRTKNAHTSIQVQRRASGLPCAMVLRRTSCSPRCANSFSHRHPRIDGWGLPGRTGTSSADLTPATGARTTRLGRTPQRRSSACRLFAHGPKPALRRRLRAQRCRVHRTPPRV